MNTATIAECMTLSFADTPFPKVVERLVGAGVTSYTADLIKLRNTYYDGCGEAFDEKLPLTECPAIASRFDSEVLMSAIKAIQRGEVGYAEFLRRIMRSGCSHYEVFIAGRKAMYFSRDGEFYTEPFPAGK